MIKNFISDIIDSADGVVMSTGNAVDKIVSISNPLIKRENESSEDYQIRLEYLKRQKEKKLQFKSDQQEVKKQSKLERKNIKLEITKVKQETKQARITGRVEEKSLYLYCENFN